MTNMNAIYTHARRYDGPSTGHITFRCGHREMYSARTSEGWAIVAGLSAGTLCVPCGEIRSREIEQAIADLPQLTREYEEALAQRDALMTELGAPIWDARVQPLQMAVWHADQKLRAGKFIIPNGGRV